MNIENLCVHLSLVPAAVLLNHSDQLGSVGSAHMTLFIQLELRIGLPSEGVRPAHMMPSAPAVRCPCGTLGANL